MPRDALLVPVAILSLLTLGAVRQATWQFARNADVTIGVTEGAPENMLHRVVGGFRFPDGRFVIANGGSQEVRIYDARGRFLTSGGRRGEGPGEYTQLHRVFPYGDSILAYDFRLLRLSVLTPEAKYARSFNMPQLRAGYSAQPIGAFSDGTVVIQSLRQFMMGDSPHGVHRAPTLLYRLSRTGEVIDSIASVPGWERFVLTVQVNGRAGFTTHSLPFARMPVFAVSADRVFVGSSDRYEIEVHSRAGRLERRITHNQPNRRVTRADVERLRVSRVASAAAQSDLYRQRTEEALREMPVPETMPAYSDLRVDSEGNLWVQDYRAEGETHTRWLVFDRTGKLLARVHGPAGFTVLDIGSGWIAGLIRDELDVERVVAYRLMK